VRLTPGDGVATATRAKHGVIAIDAHLAAGGRRVTAVSASGTRALPSVAETPRLVPTTQLETVTLDGRTHHTAITRPRDFDPRKKYPVLLKVYGGPHAVMVVDARDSYVMDQWYADAGFIVVRSDNRGTPNRGRAWERAILEDLISIPLEDQIAALKAMGARHPEMDLARVGVTGWSFGGYFSAMAVLLHPEVFAAAVAGAPVTDWSLYDTAYTERYMKTPAQNPDGYARTSALTHAGKLSRPLLLIHGITDDNVHFAHTLALIEALYVHAKRAEVITLSATHMVPDPKLMLAREQVQIDFFRDHLGPPP
jgi:dipeptidyl-peptidase-4